MNSAHTPSQEMEYQLPSGGFPYKDLLPGGSVVIRSMTGSEEAILLSASLDEAVKVDRIIAACTTFPEVAGQRLASKKLIMADRLMLIMGIRVQSLGAKYLLNAECSNPLCRHKWEQEVDLVADLSVEQMPRTHVSSDGTPRTLEYNPDEGIEITLPRSKTRIKMRLLTGEDEEFMARELKKGAKSLFLPKIRNGGDPMYFFNRVLSIKEVFNPETSQWEAINHSNINDVGSLVTMLSRLSTYDLQYMQAEYAKWDVSLTDSFEKPCPVCGKEVQIPLRMTAEFFRPTNL